MQVADGTSVPIFPEGWGAVYVLAWMPDSKSLLMLGQYDSYNPQIWQISYPSGEARRITDDEKSYYNINITPDGQFLAVVRNEQVAHISMTSADESNRTRQLTAGFEKTDGLHSLGWLPDGKVFFDSVVNNNSSFWVIESDGSNPIQLVKDIEPMGVSADGHHLIYRKAKLVDCGEWI